MKGLGGRFGLGRAGWRASGVLACVDGSSYLGSVCEHAAWAALRLGCAVELLNVIERPRRLPTAPACGLPAHHLPEALRDSAARLRESGVEPLALCVAEGPPAPTIRRLSDGAALVVLGRRGVSREIEPAAAGAHVRELARTCAAPVLVAAHLFLPVREALVLDDPERPDPAFGDRVATSPWLDGLEVRRVGLPREADRGRGGAGADAIAADLAQCAETAVAARADLVVAPRRWLEPFARRAARRAVAGLMTSPHSILFC